MRRSSSGRSARRSWPGRLRGALNRVYFEPFELKRLRMLVANFEHAPPRLADRLEALLRLPPAETAADLGRLVVETRDLVGRELPGLELPLRRPPGTGA